MRAHGISWIILLMLILFTGAPLSALFQLILSSEGIVEKMMRWDALKPLLNSLLLGFTVTMLASAIAFPLAFLRAKTLFRNHVWLEWLILVPYMTPPYLASMGWVLWMRNGGYLEQLFPFIHDAERFFYHFFMLAFIMSLHIYPFIYWALKELFTNIGASIEEAEMIYGTGSRLNRWLLFIPLFITAWAASALIVFVETLGEFGAPATLGRAIGFPVLTTEIYRKVASWPIDLHYAAFLSIVLLAAVLFGWWGERRLRYRFSFHLLSGKGHKTRIIRLSSFQMILSWAYIVLILMLSIGIPYSAMLIGSLTRLVGGGLSCANVSLIHYRELFSPQSTAWKAFQTSFLLALSSAFFAVLIGTLIAIVVSLRRSNIRSWIEGLALLPAMVPAIVWTIGLIIFWNAPFLPHTIYNTPAMVVLTYTLFYAPYALQYVKTSFQRIDPKLFDAAYVLQKNFSRRLFRIVLPLLSKSMLAAYLMAFIIAFRELVAALLILPPGMKTVSTYIFYQFEQGSTGAGMAAAVVSTMFTLACIMIGVKITNRIN